jgi:hypothetical protein
MLRGFLVLLTIAIAFRVNILGTETAAAPTATGFRNLRLFRSFITTILY